MKRTTTLNKSAIKSGTNIKRLKKMTDAEIDLSDDPELTPDMFAKVIVRRRLKPVVPNKVQLTVRLDSDVLAWLKSQGRGYQTKINEVMRAYMVESKTHAARTR